MESSCPICLGTGSRVIGKPKTNRISENFINKDYKVVQCANCEGYYVQPEIDFSKAQWSKLYHEHYFSSQSNWLLKKRAVELANRFDVARNYISGQDVKLLDIGCGEGKALFEGNKRGWNVTGVDIVDNRLENAKGENLKFLIGDFLELQLSEEYYDFIYLDSVLEHVPEPRLYLQKIHKLLKHGGVVYIGVPNEDSLFNLIRRLVFVIIGRKHISVKIKPFDDPYHVNGFNKKSLPLIIRESNFRILKMRNFGRKLNFLSFKVTQRGFWIGLFLLLPVEFLGKIIGKDVYYETYITK